MSWSTKVTCSLQLWCIKNQNSWITWLISAPLLRFLYYVDLAVYSKDPRKFLTGRAEIMKSDNFASLGRIIIGEYSMVCDAINSKQYRDYYLGRAQLLKKRMPADFPLFLSDADEQEGIKHKAIHDYLWEDMMPKSMKLVEQDSPEIFKGYLQELLDKGDDPTKQDIMTAVVKYVMHALFGSISDECVEVMLNLFLNGGLSGYVGGAVVFPFFIHDCLPQGKRNLWIDQAVDFISKSPALEAYEPVAGVSKEGFAELMLSVGGTAGVLGVSSLVTNLYKELPKDLVVDTTDKHEILSTLLEAARIRAPVNNVNFKIAQKTKIINVHGKDVELSKGTLCAASIGLASQDADVFSDPKTFNNKRDNLEKAIIVFNHVGFSPEGSGTRQCPGRNLAIKLAADLLIGLQKK